MKRIMGREIIDNQVEEYTSSCSLSALDPEKFDIASIAFRFQWANSIIDTKIQNGFYYGRFLDIGSYDGRMSIIMAKKPMGLDVNKLILVDAVEPYKDAYEAIAQTAETMRNNGCRITAHNLKFEDYNTDNLYCAICAFEVLEHMKDPLFCIEKMYDLLQIGGDLFITIPEEHGLYGIRDKNPYHFWTSSVQSTISVLFYDDRKWRIKQVIDYGDLIHMHVQKLTYQE